MFTNLNTTIRFLLAICMIVTMVCACTAPVMASAAGGEHGHNEPGHKGLDESKVSPADWRSDLAIYSFVVFLLLMAILTKFAWKPISEALDKREASVANNIASAQQANDDAKAMLAQYEAKLAGATDQVRAMLEEARRDSEATKQAILAEAKASAEAEAERARRDIRTATDVAVQELATKAGNLAVDLAGKVLQAKLNKDDHAKLLNDGISKFVNSEPSKN